MLYVLIYEDGISIRGIRADNYVEQGGDIIRYAIIEMKIFHRSKRFIRSMISTEDGFQYVYKNNPNYDPTDMLIEKERHGMTVHYIDEGDYPLLIEYEEYVPEY